MRDPFAGYDQWKTASPYDDDYEEEWCNLWEEGVPATWCEFWAERIMRRRSGFCHHYRRSILDCGFREEGTDE